MSGDILEFLWNNIPDALPISDTNRAALEEYIFDLAHDAAAFFNIQGFLSFGKKRFKFLVDPASFIPLNRFTVSVRGVTQAKDLRTQRAVGPGGQSQINIRPATPITIGIGNIELDIKSAGRSLLFERLGDFGLFQIVFSRQGDLSGHPGNPHRSAAAWQ